MISGVTSLVVFVICLFFMKDLSAKLRDQLMVSAQDQALVEARARGISTEEVVAATPRPWRQILKWDLVGSSFGIAVFLLVYYAAAGFFTIFYSTVFVNPNGLNFTRGPGQPPERLVLGGRRRGPHRVRRPLRPAQGAQAVHAGGGGRVPSSP